MCRFKNILLKPGPNRRAFTIVEVATALVILSVILGSVVVLMNRYVEAVMDMELHWQAFEVARGNMETLLTESRLSETHEYGTSETHPDVEWQTVVEPFYEPVTNQMWIRALCSVEYPDSKGEYQEIELEHWITNLNATQVKQILGQQEAEEEYSKLLQAGEYTDMQLTTIAYLEEKGLDVDAYKKLLEQHRRKKLEYISEKGWDGYEKLSKDLEYEEDEFLDDFGINFDDYNTFAAGYIPPKRSGLDDLYDSSGPDDAGFDASGPDGSGEAYRGDSTPEERPDNDTSEFDWSRVPPELVPLIEQLLGIKKP